MAETSQPLLPTTALLLIAHGSRQEEANADLFYFAEELRKLGRYGIVEASFLEIAAPDIAAGGASCVARGATQVILLPSFFSAGVHLRRDLTDACRQLATRFPQVRFTLAEPLGRHPLLTEILAARAREAEGRLAPD
jgi:sirohydrochlorin ferrochelatase